MSVLDRTRPFGTVFGNSDHSYVQDEKKFDHEGKEIGAAKVKAGKSAPLKAGQSEPSDQVGAQLAE